MSFKTDIDPPSPKANEVRINFLATSINISNWEFLTWTQFYARTTGVRAPRLKILGSDAAGLVDGVGDDVTAFKPSDEVRVNDR